MGVRGGWNALIDAKEQNQDTEITAIINPSSGVGTSRDMHRVNVVDDLQSADIKVVNCVATGYASKSARGGSEGEVKA